MNVTSSCSNYNVLIRAVSWILLRNSPSVIYRLGRKYSQCICHHNVLIAAACPELKFYNKNFWTGTWWWHLCYLPPKLFLHYIKTVQTALSLRTSESSVTRHCWVLLCSIIEEYVSWSLRVNSGIWILSSWRWWIKMVSLFWLNPDHSMELTLTGTFLWRCNHF